MATEQFRGLTVFITASLLYAFAEGLPTHAADGPNRQTPSDIAAGRWVDSLLGPELPATRSARQTRPRQTRPRPQRSASKRRSSLRGKLVNNPNRSDGTPSFALVDRYGGVLRYIEPVESIDLQEHLGQVVGVKHDTGDILLASQLSLPRKIRTAGSTDEVQLAQNLEPIPAGEPLPAGQSLPADEVIGDPSGLQFDGNENGPIYLEGEYEEGLNFGGCPSCGDRLCRGGGCGFGSRGVMYAHGEYLLWWLEGMNTPALVIQFQDLDVATGEVIPPISTIYGGNRLLDDQRDGGRITFGLWLDDYGQWGIEGDYLGLGELDARFVAGAKDGQVPAVGSFIGRPFFNTGVIGGVLATRGPSQEDVDTNRLDGTVSVNIRSEFEAGGIRLRHNLCCREGCDTCCGDAVGCGDCIGCSTGVGCGTAVAGSVGPLNRLCRLLRKGTRHADVLYGIRFASLNEGLQVVEDLQQFTNITTNPPTLGNDIDVVDQFVVSNEFVGGEIGYETEWKLRRWSLNFLSKVAIGNTRQTVNISGSTTIDDGAGAVATSAGGLLTQSFDHPDGFVVGNIGTYERDEFSMIPEIGLTMGYNLTRRLKLTAGYTLLYWSNVVRPGDQIDLDVNGNLLNRNGVPDPTTIVPGDHPRFVYRQTDLWAQGLNFGAEYTW